MIILMNLIIAYIINGIITNLMHSIACFSTINKFKIIILSNTKKCFFNILSLDYYFADAYKTFIKHKQKYFSYANQIGHFIKKSNAFNLIISIIFAFIICYSDIMIITNSNLFNIFKMFVLVRCISRSIEIVVAFYKDVVYKQRKSSSLKSGERITLAVKSYIDVIIMYGCVYDLFKIFNCNNIFYALIRSFGISTFTEVEYNGVILASLIISLQVLTSMVLVIFSLARYIGEED